MQIWLDGVLCLACVWSGTCGEGSERECAWLVSGQELVAKEVSVSVPGLCLVRNL